MYVSERERERERTQLTHKISSLKPTGIINRLTGSIYTLTIILTLTLSTCSTNLDEDNGIKTMATGNSHTVALKADGTLWAWGFNEKGQLGNGTNTNSNTPVRVNLEGVIAVTAAGDHTVALKNDGTLWAWGFNERGQLGDGTGGDGTNDYDKNIPVRVMKDGAAFTGVIAVDAGSFHTVALKNDGTLWAWGLNRDGQLGDGIGGDGTYDYDKNTPVKVMKDGAAFTGVIAVDAGAWHTVVLKNDGTLWAWGRNYEGQLGDGTNIDRNTPVKVMKDGAAFTGVIAVVAGARHTVVLKNDGTLWAWGRNNYGQLGDGTGGDKTESYNKNTPVQVKGGDNWASVSGASYHTIANKRDGTLWAWGWNEHGQLGLGKEYVGQNKTTPMRLGKAADLVSVSAGQYHSTALRRSGILWTWGLNDSGQLGDGTNEDRYRPVTVKWE